jgi:hypothetical protein
MDEPNDTHFTHGDLIQVLLGAIEGVVDATADEIELVQLANRFVDLNVDAAVSFHPRCRLATGR